MEIRAARRADAAELCRLAREVLDIDDPHPVHAAWTERLLGHVPWSDIAVADDGEQLRGMAWLLAQPLRLRGTVVPCGQLEQVAVERGAREQGVARRLLGHLRRRADQHGYRLLIVRGDPALYTRLDLPPMWPQARAGRIAIDRIPEVPHDVRSCPATGSDAEIFSAWERSGSWAVIRARTPADWRTEIGRDHGHPWRTQLWRVERGPVDLGVIGIRALPGRDPVLHVLEPAPSADVVALAAAGVRLAAELGAQTTAAVALPRSHPARRHAPWLPDAGEAVVWGVEVRDPALRDGALPREGCWLWVAP